MNHPLPGAKVTQVFGENPQNYLPTYNGHEGIDFSAVVGTPVYAAHEGNAYQRWSAGYGNYVEIVSDKMRTVYAHLSVFLLPSGQPVFAGQRIALSGNTGNSTAPHLHFGVCPLPRDYANGYQGYVDPEPYLNHLPDLYVHINDVQEGIFEWLVANKVKGIKILIKGQAEWLRALRAAIPSIEIIGRWHWSYEEQQRLLSLGPVNCAKDMADRIANDPCLPYVDWVEGLNEIGGYPYRPNPGYEAVLNFMQSEIYFSGRVRSWGKKYLGGSWSTGNPDEKWLDDDDYRQVVENFYDGASLHEYYAPLMQSPGYEGNVFRHYLWAAKFPNLPLYITECGADSLAPNPHLTAEHKGYKHFTDPVTAANDLKWYAERCAPTVVAYSPYCFGVEDPTWDSFNWWGWGENELLIVPNTEVPVGLVNGDFEGGFRKYNGINELEVAEGWTPFWASPPAKWYDDDVAHYDFRPEYKKAGGEMTGPTRAISGSSQQWFSTFAGHRAGIYQQISATPGQKITLTATMQSWHTQVPSKPEISMDEDWIVNPTYLKQVGIDPTGGIDAFADTVVWSAEYWENDKWFDISAETTAQAEKVTLFVYGEPKYAFQANNCYVDSVTITLPDTDIFEVLIDHGQDYVIPRNPDAALHKAAFALNPGATEASDEIRYMGWVYQAFWFPGDANTQHWFFAKEGQWDAITYREQKN